MLNWLRSPIVAPTTEQSESEAQVMEAKFKDDRQKSKPLVTARVHLKSPMQTRSKAGNLAKEKDGAKDPVATLRAERAEFFLVCTRTCEL